MVPAFRPAVGRSLKQRLLEKAKELYRFLYQGQTLVKEFVRVAMNCDVEIA